MEKERKKGGKREREEKYKQDQSIAPQLKPTDRQFNNWLID
jgi:hypothetical protein